jgi:hypothetical protein
MDLGTDTTYTATTTTTTTAAATTTAIVTTTATTTSITANTTTATTTTTSTTTRRTYKDMHLVIRLDIEKMGPMRVHHTPTQLLERERRYPFATYGRPPMYSRAVHYFNMGLQLAQPSDRLLHLVEFMRCWPFNVSAYRHISISICPLYFVMLRIPLHVLVGSNGG